MPTMPTMPATSTMATSLKPVARLAFSALLLALLAVPAGAVYSYGSIVDKNDYDFQQAPSVRPTVPAAGKFVLPCFLDNEGDGRAGPGDALYLAVRTGLTAACDTVRSKDVRLTGFGALAAGSEAKSSDADGYLVLTQLGTPAVPMHAVRVFNDQETLATVRKTDTVYLDLVNLAASRIDVGDVRLSPLGAMKAGTRVQAGDPDQNLMLQEIGAAPSSLYTANMVYEFGKAWYLNVDLDAAAGGAVEEGDVRLTATVPNPFADIAAGFGNPGEVVDGLRFSAGEVAAGATFQAYIQVKNPVATVGSALVETRLDGVLVDARGTPTLAQNEAATLVVTLVAPSEPGQHKVQAGETTAFFDVVAAAPATPAAATQGTTTEGPGASAAPAEVQRRGASGLGAIAPLVLLGVAFVLQRRLA